MLKLIRKVLPGRKIGLDSLEAKIGLGMTPNQRQILNGNIEIAKQHPATTIILPKRFPLDEGVFFFFMAHSFSFTPTEKVRMVRAIQSESLSKDQILSTFRILCEESVKMMEIKIRDGGKADEIERLRKSAADAWSVIEAALSP